MTKEKILGYTHAVFTIALALFFINAGVKKYIPKPARITDNTALIEAVNTDKYDKPVSFKLTMKAMRQSGFFYMIGVFQILSGVLMLIPKTRLLGLLTLLPVAVNIFTLHLFMDNRMSENIETGLLLALTLILTAYYYKKLIPLVK